MFDADIFIPHLFRFSKCVIQHFPRSLGEIHLNVSCNPWKPFNGHSRFSGNLFRRGAQFFQERDGKALRLGKHGGQQVFRLDLLLAVLFCKTPGTLDHLLGFDGHFLESHTLLPEMSEIHSLLFMIKT